MSPGPRLSEDERARAAAEAAEQVRATLAARWRSGVELDPP